MFHTTSLKAGQMNTVKWHHTNYSYVRGPINAFITHRSVWLAYIAVKGYFYACNLIVPDILLIWSTLLSDAVGAKQVLNLSRWEERGSVEEVRLIRKLTGQVWSFTTKYNGMLKNVFEKIRNKMHNTAVANNFCSPLFKQAYLYDTVALNKIWG